MKIKFRIEYPGNPEVVCVHFSEKLQEESFINKTIENMNGIRSELLTLLEGVRGAQEVSIRKYEIALHRGAVFTQDEVALAAVGVMKMWFSLHFNEDIEMEQLPTLRNDVYQHRCRECEEAQEAFMRETMRDLDTLEY